MRAPGKTAGSPFAPFVNTSPLIDPSAGGAALSETKAQQQQDRQSNPNQRPHGCSSWSLELQCAVQTKGIPRDLFQSVENTIDAISSNTTHGG